MIADLFHCADDLARVDNVKVLLGVVAFGDLGRQEALFFKLADVELFADEGELCFFKADGAAVKFGGKTGKVHFVDIAAAF